MPNEQMKTTKQYHHRESKQLLPSPWMSPLKTLIALAVLTTVFALNSARAQLLVSEPFNLTLGAPLNNSGSGTGWGANVWTNGYYFTNVAQSSFSAGSGGTLYTVQQSGAATQCKNSAGTDTTNRSPQRYFGQAYTIGNGAGQYTNLWVSWLLDTSGSGATGHGFVFLLANNSDNVVRVGKVINNNNWTVTVGDGIVPGTLGSAVVAASGTANCYGNWFSVLNLAYDPVNNVTMVTHYRAAVGETTANLTDPTTFSVQYSTTYPGNLTFNNVNVAAHNNLNQKWDEIRIGQTYANVAPVTSSKAITWGGYSDHTWSVSSALNWTNLSTATKDSFANGANVTFDDTPGTAQTITVSGTPLPGSIAVNATNNYTLNGAFAGDGGLTMANSGILTLNGANVYNGATVINAGTVVLGDNSALGSAAGGLTIQTGGTLDLNGYALGAKSSAMNSGVLVNGSATPASIAGAFVMNAANTFGGVGDITLSGSLGGLSATFIKTNANKVTLTAPLGTVGFSWSLLQGAIQFGDGTVGGSPATTGTAVNMSANTAVIFNTVATNSVHSGAITGTGTVTKTGAGTVTLTGANTYAGVTLVNNGTLKVANNAGLGASTGVTVANGAALDLNGSGVANIPVTLSGTGIASGGALVNSSTNAASLAGTVSNLTATSVGGVGNISIGGTMAGGGYTLANVGIGTLYLNGGFTGGGSVTVASGGSVLAGNAAHLGSLTVAALNLTGSTTNSLFASPGNIIAVTGNGGLVPGPLVGSVAINVPLAVPGVGQYPLVTHVGSIGGGGFPAFVLGTLPPYTAGYLSNNTANSSIDLVVTSADVPLWTGAFSSEWSVNTITTPKNWKLQSAGTQIDYINGVLARFDDTAVSTSVDISVADVTPNTVIFSNSTQNYSVTGTQAISGTTSLKKQGTGSLTFYNVNKYTGGTTASGGGSIILGANNVLPGNLLTLDNATVDFNGNANAFSSIVVNHGGGTLAGAGTLTNTGTIMLNGNAELSPSVVFGATSILWTNTGASVLTLDAMTVHGYSVNSTLNCYPQIRLGGPLLFSQNGRNNSFQFYGGFDLNGNILTLQPQNNLAAANPSIVSGSITGNGAIIVQQDAGLYVADNGQYVFSGANNYSGTTTLNGENLCLNSPTALGNSTLIINPGAYTPSALANTSSNAVTLTANNPMTWNGDFGFNSITSLGGGAPSYANLNLGAGAVTLGNSCAVTISNNTLTVGGVITDGGSGFGLTKNGEGRLTLGGANTYSGATTVNEGTLILSTRHAASGDCTVADGATLGVTNAQNGASATTANLNLGIAGPTTNVFLNLGSTTVAALRATGAVTVSGASTVAIADANLLAAGNTYPLIKYGSISGDNNFLLSVPAGVTATLTNDPSNLWIALKVSAVVPPVNTTPTNIVVGINGANLSLSWPSDHTGWRLLAQTNHLAAGVSSNTNDWATVAGSAATNRVSIPINATNPGDFFRLVYP